MQKSGSEGLKPSNKFTKNTNTKLRGLGASAVKSRLIEDEAEWKSAGGDVSYRDRVLPPAQKRISREQLDKQLINQASRSTSQYLRRISDGDTNGSFTTLARCCLRVIAENIHEKAIQDSLANRIMNFRHVDNLCRRVKKRFNGSEMPFSIWETLLAIDADAIPTKMKTYTGLVLDDVDELVSLNSLHNATLVDLSNTAFQKADIYKIRMYFSNSLVALRLDHLTLMDDDTITILSRDVGPDEGRAFAKLEVLTTRDCKLVTDRSAPRLARFTALKMLDLRGTSCTTATKDILRASTKPPFVCAFTPVQLSLFSGQRLDKTYRHFNRVSLTPFVKNFEDLPESSAATEEPCILVTELARLDSSKVLDPRLPTVKNRFVASHHVYGNVYTSVPISSESLRDDGSQESSKGSAFRHGKHSNVMSGHLPISQADVGWKRFAPKRKPSSQEIKEDSEDDVGDSDLEPSITEVQETRPLETEDSKLPTPEEARLAAFYQQATASALSHRKSEIPDKDPLMLLRFFKQSSSSAHSTLPAQAEVIRPAAKMPERLNDQAILRVKKRPRTGATATDAILKKQPSTLAINPSVRATPPPSTSVSTSTGPRPPQVKAPMAIIRKPPMPSKLSFTNILSKRNTWT